MTQPDPISIQLDRLARLLEDHGYAIEVNYTSVTITVWMEEWPIHVRLAREQPASCEETTKDKDDL